MYIEPPPAIYDHAPVVPVYEVTIPWGDMDEVCGPFELACARPAELGLLRLASGMALPPVPRSAYFAVLTGRPDTCVIILPAYDGWGVTPELIDQMRRHEIAHCNGWRHALSVAK